jgi:probable HAF family extracellular repeat protein
MRNSSSAFSHALTICVAVAMLAGCNSGGSQLAPTTTPRLPTVGAEPLSPSLSGQARRPRYAIKDIGTLGGKVAAATGLNNSGSVAGASTLLGDQTVHAFLWKHGEMTDLGSLGEPGSRTGENAPINEEDEVSGWLDTSTPDPYGEDFCGNGGFICLPFAWQKGVMTKLPILGGNNAAALQINDRGEIAGIGEEGHPDKTCVPPQVLDQVAVIWGPRKDEIRELPPYGNDTEAVASGINEKGEVVGTSGKCKINLPMGAIEAILWRNGRPINLGNLGGRRFNIGFSINNKSEVTGQANTGRHCCHGLPVFHAYLWRKGVMRDLGTLPGDPASLGNSINNKTQIVGLSETPSTVRGFLWQNGTMYDMNDLIPADAHFLVQETLGINDRGQIAGYGLNAKGYLRAFLATPCDAANLDKSCGDARGSATLPVVLPASVRALLQRMSGHRLGIWPIR